MEYITITHRIINGKSLYNKRYNNYEKGFYGGKISKKEYEESKNNLSNRKVIFTETNNKPNILGIIERIIYEN